MMRENSLGVIDGIAGNACAAVVFAIRASIDRRRADSFATHEWRLKAYCTDSESRTLAIKKFSCSPA
jgi:hypothetical protein